MHRRACAFADLWAELIEERLAADCAYLLAKFAEEGDGARQVVLRDVSGDSFQVGLNPAGKLYARSSRTPAASARAWYLRSRRSMTSSAGMPGELSSTA